MNYGIYVSELALIARNWHLWQQVRASYYKKYIKEQPNP